jgi:hypothetical protein
VLELTGVIVMPNDIRELQIQLEKLVSEHSLALVIAGLIAVCDDNRLADRTNSAAWDSMAKALGAVGSVCDL